MTMDEENRLKSAPDRPVNKTSIAGAASPSAGYRANAREALEDLAMHHNRRAQAIHDLLRALPLELPHAADEALWQLAMDARR